MSRTQWLILLALLGYYTLATVPFIGRSPRWNAAEIALIAPAYQLAATGIYGNPIYRDFHRTEQRNYEFMPLHPLQLAATIKLFGANPVALRLLSFANGLAAVILLFVLTRRLHDVPTALAAVATLVCVRLGSSIPHVDLARIVHYDILVPVWVLAACFVWMMKPAQRYDALLFGICAGMATLAHIYGAFVLMIPLLMSGWQLLRSRVAFWIGSGWLLTLAPFLFYVGQDVAAYRGQMSRHSGRFDLFNWQFYVENLRTERLRFLTWFNEPPLLNIGLFILVSGVILTHIILVVRKNHTREERFTLVSLGAVWLPLALLISFKRYAYVALLMPFFALQVGFAAMWIWRRGKVGKLLISVLATLALIESGLGVVQGWHKDREVVAYAEMTGPIAAEIPQDSTVMGIPLFWLGLKTTDFVGLDLAFIESDATVTLNRYAPDFILVQDHLLYQYRRDPTAAPRTELVTRWEEVIGYIETHCHTPKAVSETITYGKILLAVCSK